MDLHAMECRISQPVTLAPWHLEVLQMSQRSVSMNVDSGEKTWLTPPEVIRALGRFTLDPCCPPVMPWRTADKMLTHRFREESNFEGGGCRNWRIWNSQNSATVSSPTGTDTACGAILHTGGMLCRSFSEWRSTLKRKLEEESCSCSPAPTRRHGTIGYSRMRAVRSSYVVGCASTARTARWKVRLRPRQLLSHTRPQTSPLSAPAAFPAR